MNESLFENRAETLKNTVAKEIAYTYSVFVPKGTENITSKMKRNILLSDRKFLDSSLQEKLGSELIFPYEVLKENIEKQIDDFYGEFNLSIHTLEKLSRYGDRADVFKKQFRDNLEKSKNTTLNVVQRELHLQILQGKDVKSVISHMQNVVSKRMASLRRLLEDNAGQMQQYMVLWDYQDKGCTRYRLRTNGDTCKDCTSLDGKIFVISEAESGKNFIPLHPNCDCSAEVLDEAGNAVFVIEKDNADETEDENSTDAFDYLATSLKQMILGNFSEDGNLLGTLGQVALGLLGLDLPMDIRDLLYDITHFKLTPEHAFQTLMDVLALFPVVGGVKYTDEIGDALKFAAKHGDGAIDATKAVNKATDLMNNASTNKNYARNDNIAVDNYLQNNVNPLFREKVKEAFKSDAKVTVLEQDIIVYRYHGGNSSSRGHWYTPNETANPSTDLALPPGNTYQHKDTFIVPKGTTILEGTVAPNFGQIGGGYQFYISDPAKLIKK